MWHKPKLSVFFIFICLYLFNINIVHAKSNKHYPQNYKLNPEIKYSFLTTLELDANGCNKRRECRNSKGLGIGKHAKTRNIVLSMFGLDEQPEFIQFQNDMINNPKNAFANLSNNMLKPFLNNTEQTPQNSIKNTTANNNSGITDTISNLGKMFFNPNDID